VASPARRSLKFARKAFSWALVRPEFDRLHELLTAQLTELAAIQSRGLASLEARLDARSPSDPLWDVEAAFAHRCLVELPRGSRVLELTIGSHTVGPALAMLGYDVTLVTRRPPASPPDGVRLVVGPFQEAELGEAWADAVVALGMTLEARQVSAFRHCARDGAMLVASRRAVEVEPLVGWSTEVEAVVCPDGSRLELITGRAT
jgi:hypothetical protein